MADKSKHPGRVAWGKKLAQISKELKAKKKESTVEEVIKKDISIDVQTENKLNSHHLEVIVGVGGLLVVVVALYWQYKNNKSDHITDEQPGLNKQSDQIDHQSIHYNYF